MLLISRLGANISQRIASRVLMSRMGICHNTAVTVLSGAETVESATGWEVLAKGR